MANKFTYDTTAKLFILNAGVTSLDLKTEFYSWVKSDWKTDANLNRLRFPIESIGGNDLGSGVTISPYYSLLYGWKVRPPEENATITIVGNLITSDGSSPFVGTVGTFDTVIKQVVSGNSLTSGGAVDSQVWGAALEGGLSAGDLMRIMASVLAGNIVDATGPTVTVRDINNTKNRLMVTVDGLGNRSIADLEAS